MPELERPIRVLHLLGRPADYQTGRALDTLTRAPSTAERVTIGAGGRWRNPLSAFLGLRRTGGDYDLVQCWDDRALAVASMAGARKIVYSPQTYPRPAAVRWLRAAMAYRDVQVVCPSTTVRRHLARRGVPLERCHLIRPGVDFSRIRRKPDAALRAALGFAADDFVVLAAGESTTEADHARAVWAMSILHVLDPKAKVLLWGRGPRAGSAVRLGAKLGQPTLAHDAEFTLGRPVAFEELLPAVDMAVVSAGGPVPALPIAACMAAGLPIVSTVTASVSELLEDRHTALMTRGDKPRLIVEKFRALRADPSLTRTLTDTARAEAYELWPATKFADRWRQLHAQVAAGAAVSLPD